MSQYKITKERQTYSVYNGKTVVAKGCISEQDALTALWVLNGSVEDDYYEVFDDEGSIRLREKKGENNDNK